MTFWIGMRIFAAAVAFGCAAFSKNKRFSIISGVFFLGMACVELYKSYFL
jgi:hypothetical protein